MMNCFILTVLCFCYTLHSTQAFQLQYQRQRRINIVRSTAAGVSEATRTTPDSSAVANKSSNLSRKLRRHLRSATADTFSQLIYTPEYDDFLKNRASESVFKILSEKIQKRARQLNIQLKKDFGTRTKVERLDIVATAVSAGTFTKLVSAVQAAGLAESLQSGFLTVFAPSDTAFDQLPEGTLEGLLADIPKLQRLLKNHVVDGTNSSKKLLDQSGQALKTLAETELKVKAGRGDSALLINDAEVLKANIKCRNGYIHVIDKVLIPKE